MTTKIEIVTHAFCPRGTDTYAELLRWQFASLIHYPTHADVTLTVCYTREDPTTSKAVQRIAELLETIDPPGVTIKALDFPPGSLFRRGVGRNFCALQTTADVVWFTDVDYLFGPGCLDAVADQCGRATELAQPAELWISRDHATGDQDVEQGRREDLPEINPERFAKRRQKVCIGGVQIVGGYTANKVGYCSGTKWAEPVSADEGFRSCKCDKAFRRINRFQAQRLQIPNTYRLRHSHDGRDYDLSGCIRGKAVW